MKALHLMILFLFPKDEIKRLIFDSDLSERNKIIMYSQSILETGNFKNIKYFNIFGILKKNKKVKYTSYKQCFNHRVLIMKKHKSIIHKSYATDKNYLNKIRKIMQKEGIGYYNTRKFVQHLVNRCRTDCIDTLTYDNGYFLNYTEESFNYQLGKIGIAYQEIECVKVYVIDNLWIDKLEKDYEINKKIMLTF
jgi:hypothetical protein